MFLLKFSETFWMTDERTLHSTVPFFTTAELLHLEQNTNCGLVWVSHTIHSSWSSEWETRRWTKVYSGDQWNSTHGRNTRTHLCWPELALRYEVRGWRANYWPNNIKINKYKPKQSRDVIFSENETPAGALHSIAKGLYHLFRSSQYAGIPHIQFDSRK